MCVPNLNFSRSIFLSYSISVSGNSGLGNDVDLWPHAVQLRCILLCTQRRLSPLSFMPWSKFPPSYNLHYPFHFPLSPSPSHLPPFSPNPAMGLGSAVSSPSGVRAQPKIEFDAF